MTWRDRLDLARAWVTLLAADVGARRSSLERVRRLLAWGMRPPLPPGPDTEQRIARLYDLVRLAADHHVRPMRALARTITLEHLLRFERIATEFHIGARPGGGTIEAHSWLTWQGEPIGEAADVAERYPTMAEWPSAPRSA